MLDATVGPCNTPTAAHGISRVHPAVLWRPPCIHAFHHPSSSVASKHAARLLRHALLRCRLAAASGYGMGRGRLEQIRASDPDSARWSRLLKLTRGSSRRRRRPCRRLRSPTASPSAWSLPAVDLPTFAGEHDDYDPDDDVCGDAMYAVQEGLQEFVDTCTATALALRNLENGLRALGQVRSGSAAVPPPVATMQHVCPATCAAMSAWRLGMPHACPHPLQMCRPSAR